ncbi:MAG: glycoside hydrolase family 2 TIM barrel-domain containing protein [Rikenellaceae bacterium]
MKRFVFLVNLIFAFNLAIGSTTTINKSWKFTLDDPKGAQKESFDDSSWRELHLPHDWAFENGYSSDGAQADRGGYAMGGIGWYRKNINITQEQLKDRLIYIDFDGIYMNSEVWINGKYLGKRPYGYISFYYELTQNLRVGENIIAIRVDNSLEPSARWYHGCGIYGNVALRSELRTHFERDETYITTPSTKGTVRVRSNILSLDNVGDKQLTLRVLDSDNEVIGSWVQHIYIKKGDNPIDQTFKTSLPKLWSPDSPNLYTLEYAINNGDSKRTRFGFRDFKWEVKSGFYLNGVQTKLYGVCEHLEGGPIGAMYTEQMLRWKLNIIKEMGCNAVRTSHNPQVPMFYDICDEIGLLVMNEAFDGWERKADFDYGMQAFSEWWERDLRAFIRRDRNHPSVFMWSVGNETHGDYGEQIVAVCHEEDPTRMVTSSRVATEYMDVFGVHGIGENPDFINSFSSDTQPLIGTENPHTWQVRGYYRTQTWQRKKINPKLQNSTIYHEVPNLCEKEIFGYEWASPSKWMNSKQHFNSSYDNALGNGTVRHMIQTIREKDWYAGNFRWTGFDYSGEAAFVHGGWPFRAFMGGAIDLAGFTKDLYYLYQSQWSDVDMVHILPHWTHPTMEVGTKIPVWVYTTGDEVELIVNGENLGRRRKGSNWNEMQCEWLVPWQPGYVEAIAYRDGQEICRTKQLTSGAPTQLGLSVENPTLKADCEDISIVTIRQEDRNGTLYPYGENKIYAKVIGGARVLSMESGDPTDCQTNFEAPSRKSFFGLNRAFIQSTDDNKDGEVSVIFAAINGDKKLYLSDKISITAQELVLRGEREKCEYKIYYTTDGSIPTKSSKEYTEPFAIKLETTITAVIYDADKVVLEMEELFSEDEGIYWGVPGEEHEESNISSDQAEKAKLVECTVQKKGGANFYGGYIIPAPNKGSMEWYQENDAGERTAALYIRYSLKEQGATMKLYNNDKFVMDIEFKPTGSIASSWQDQVVKLPLTSGANYLRLESASKSTPSIDQVYIE